MPANHVGADAFSVFQSNHAGIVAIAVMLAASMKLVGRWHHTGRL
jgi:hypothetical protein